MSSGSDRVLQICARCVMDTTDPDIVFDEQGVCNHCYTYSHKSSAFDWSKEERDDRLHKLVAEIKRAGQGKHYDCIIGVSGGLDSTYLAYLVKGLGLRPLAVHFDNGWNNELAVSNIEKVLKLLDIDLYTFVVDWPEFRDLQLSFLKASTPDGEVPTDHAILSLLHVVAEREGVKYILPGVNVRTESIMPLKWGYGYHDYKYISSVQKQFGSRPLKTFPHMSLIKMAYYKYVKGIQLVHILNYVDYRRAEVMDLLQNKLGWVYYGGKHYESIYTRFFQAYVLPRKFNIDKRKAHYSNLICSGQLTRSQALLDLQKAVYPADKLAEDREYAIKKLAISEADFDRIMALPPKTFFDYPNQYSVLELIKKVIGRNTTPAKAPELAPVAVRAEHSS